MKNLDKADTAGAFLNFDSFGKEFINAQKAFTDCFRDKIRPLIESVIIGFNESYIDFTITDYTISYQADYPNYPNRRYRIIISILGIKTKDEKKKGYLLKSVEIADKENIIKYFILCSLGIGEEWRIFVDIKDDIYMQTASD